MADIYAELIPLTARLGEIDHEIESVTAPLRAKRAEVQAQIDEVVARIYYSKSSANPDQTGRATATTAPAAVVHDPPADAIPRIPPRQVRLLNELAKRPGAGLGALAIAMYDVDDRAKRGALSAEFSTLNKLGLVEAVSPGTGQFKLTRLGQRLLSREENSARAQQ